MSERENRNVYCKAFSLEKKTRDLRSRWSEKQKICISFLHVMSFSSRKQKTSDRKTEECRIWVEKIEFAAKCGTHHRSKLPFPILLFPFLLLSLFFLCIVLVRFVCYLSPHIHLAIPWNFTPLPSLPAVVFSRIPPCIETGKKERSTTAGWNL